MKIAIITSLYPPYARGGAEVIAQRVVHGLRDAGHDVIVITTTPQRSHRMPVVEVHEGVSIHRFYPANIFSFVHIAGQPLWKRLVFGMIDLVNISSYGVIRRILSHEKPDLVLTHNLKGIGYLTPRAIASCAIKHIHTVHDVQLAVPSGLLMFGNEIAIHFFAPYAALMRWIFGAPDVVASPSAWLLQFYEHAGFFMRSKRAILRNPITSAATPVQQHRTGPVTYAYVGQLEPHKGIEDLLSAFSEVAHRREGVHLIVAGGGTLFDRIRFKYADNPFITILGAVPHQELADRVWRHAHYTVVPSVCYENSPGVVYDSMAAGVPVIAADIGGCAELLKLSGTGYIIEPGSRYELMKALEVSADQAENSRTMGEHGRIFIRQFETAAYIRELLAL